MNIRRFEYIGFWDEELQDFRAIAEKLAEDIRIAIDQLEKEKAE